jgi:hypothetical protein
MNNKSDGHDWSGVWHELPYCKICGSLEGGTTTECPGKTMSFLVSQVVYHGWIDFRDGKWCNQPAIGMSHIYGTSREPYEAIDDVEEYAKRIGEDATADPVKLRKCTSCYCCPECGHNVIEGHADGCKSDPAAAPAVGGGGGREGR